MIIQIADDFYLNTEQVNYIKGFKDLADGKDKTEINFTNKDCAILPFSISDFNSVIREYLQGGGLQDEQASNL